MELQKVIAERYSVRDYAATPIPDEALETILRAAQCAPTAVNKQPQRITVVRSEEGLAKIRELSRCAFNAPAVLLFAYDTDAQWTNPFDGSLTSGQQDVSIAATHAMLVAWDLGIGSCWVNFFTPAEVQKAFNLPESETVLLIMPIGYPGEKAAPSPMHAVTKPLDELVRYI